MVEITFKEMSLSFDGRTVFIKGDFFGEVVDVKLSVLQLAKVFGSDKIIAQEAEQNFGSEELEDKCTETRDVVKNFPNIDVWTNNVELSDCWIDSSEIDKGIIRIFGENMCGWENKGILIRMSREIYGKVLGGKDFKIILTPFFCYIFVVISQSW
jgi:hypothetical protein